MGLPVWLEEMTAYLSQACPSAPRPRSRGLSPGSEEERRAASGIDSLTIAARHSLTHTRTFLVVRGSSLSQKHRTEGEGAKEAIDSGSDNSPCSFSRFQDVWTDDSGTVAEVGRGWR